MILSWFTPMPAMNERSEFNMDKLLEGKLLEDDKASSLSDSREQPASGKTRFFHLLKKQINRLKCTGCIADTEHSLVDEERKENSISERGRSRFRSKKPRRKQRGSPTRHKRAPHEPPQSTAAGFVAPSENNLPNSQADASPLGGLNRPSDGIKQRPPGDNNLPTGANLPQNNNNPIFGNGTSHLEVSESRSGSNSPPTRPDVSSTPDITPKVENKSPSPLGPINADADHTAQKKHFVEKVTFHTSQPDVPIGRRRRAIYFPPFTAGYFVAVEDLPEELNPPTLRKLAEEAYVASVRDGPKRRRRRHWFFADDYSPRPFHGHL